MRQARVWALGMALMMTAGAAFAQQGGGGRGGRGRGGGGALRLLAMPEVQTELKLEQAQKDLLMQLGMEMREKGRTLFQNTQSAAPEERQKQFAAFEAENMKKVGEILDAKQMARLHQLGIQQEGNRALGRPEVADQLKLTPEQREKVKAALDTERAAMREAFQGFGNDATDAQRQEGRQKMAAARMATDTTLNAVLTDAQKTQFKAMQGAAFTFPERRRGPGGGNAAN